MLRETFLFLSENRLARRIATDAPFAAAFSRRFVAGDTLDDAVAAVRRLNAEGMTTSLDYLGEAVNSRAEAEAARETIKQVIERIAAEGLDGNVSLKLTQLGQDIAEDFVHANAVEILELARSCDLFVRFDMEDNEYTQRTLDFFRRVREEGHTNCGVVIQSYLYRSEKDIETLNAMGARVRLCKGAYKEPERVAFPDKRDVDANFVRLMQRLLDEGTYPGIATHDEAMISATLAHVRENSVPADSFEFQMLYGVRRDLQQRIVRDGFKLRIYVPFGDAWYPYFMRRLAERPANLFFIVRNVLRESPVGFLLGGNGRHPES